MTTTARLRFPAYLRSGAKTPGSAFPRVSLGGERNLAIALSFAERLELGGAGERICRLIRDRQFTEARLECDAALRGAHEQMLRDAGMRGGTRGEASKSRSASTNEHEQLVRRNLIRLSLMLQDLEASKLPS